MVDVRVVRFFSVSSSEKALAVYEAAEKIAHKEPFKINNLFFDGFPL